MENNIDEKSKTSVPNNDANKLKEGEKGKFRWAEAGAKIDEKYDKATDWTKKKLDELKEGAKTGYDNMKKTLTTNPFKKEETDEELPPPEENENTEGKNQESKKSFEETKKEILAGQEIKEGSELNLKFPDPESEESIGLSDLLPKEVRKVQIISGERFGKKYDGEIGNRQGAMGGFYNNSKEYIPVFNDFKVKVLEYDANYLQNFDKEKEEKTKGILDKLEAQNELQKYKDSAEGEAKLKKIIEKAVEYGIDPFMALNIIENSKSFNLKDVSLEDMDLKLTMVCRKLQTAQNRYETVSKKQSIQDGMFSPDFLAFYHSVYGPQNLGDPEEQKDQFPTFNQENYAQTLKSYGKYHGKQYSDEDIKKYSNEALPLYNSIREGSLEVKGKTTGEDMLKIADKYLGWKYKMGGSGEGNKKQIDCSQLVVQCMKYCKSSNGNGIVSENYDNTAHGLYSLTQPKSKEQVQKGDLIFLYDENQKRITHVEIATGPANADNIPIVDASSSVGSVSHRMQGFSWHKGKVLVGRPKFYA